VLAPCVGIEKADAGFFERPSLACRSIPADGSASRAIWCRSSRPVRRHGIRAIDPWPRPGSRLSGPRPAAGARAVARCRVWNCRANCRGGMFTSDAAHITRSGATTKPPAPLMRPNRARARPCIVLVVGGLPQYSRPGSTALEGYRKAARSQVDDAIARDDGLCPAPRRLPLAIEPLHPAYAADRRPASQHHEAGARYLRTGLDPQTYRRASGVALDVYHILGGTRTWLPQIARTGKDRLLAFSTSATGWCRPGNILNDRRHDGRPASSTIKSVAPARSRRRALPGYSEIEILFQRMVGKKPMDEVFADLQSRGTVQRSSGAVASSFRKRTVAWCGRAGGGLFLVGNRIAAGRPSSGLRARSRPTGNWRAASRAA